MKPSSLISHFFAAAIITIILLVVYASVQQVHRSAANDPQIQIAKDVSNALANGKSINTVLSKDTVDLTQSLAVFTEVFDKNGKPIASTGFLNGSLPKPPAGIFEFTNQKAEDILTWQPRSDVRLAMVFEKINSPDFGFVAAGRSLKETEIRESNLLQMVVIGWILCMLALTIHLFTQGYFSKRIAK